MTIPHLLTLLTTPPSPAFAPTTAATTPTDPTTDVALLKPQLSEVLTAIKASVASGGSASSSNVTTSVAAVVVPKAP